MRIAIVGNGIIGLALAHRLLADHPGDDLRVGLIGPAERPGCGTLAAAAMLNSLAEVETGVLDDPVRRERLDYNRAATALWPALLDELEDATGDAIRRGTGTHVVAGPGGDAETANLSAIEEACAALGEPCSQVDPRDIPGYRPATGFDGIRALHLPGEGWVNPLDLVGALATTLSADGRCAVIDASARSIDPHTRTTRLEGGEQVPADAVVLCPGSTFTAIAEASGVGDAFPRVRHGIGVTVLLATPDEPLAGCVRTPTRSPATGLYAVPQVDGATLVGATSEIVDDPGDYDPAAAAAGLARAAADELHAQHADARILATRVGWRAIADDGLPLLGRTAIPGLVVATGMNRDGLHCAPLIARQLADSLLGVGDDAPPARYRPDRG
jgi:glycine/D-amino acid oxidase-like deaminating enzyme